MDYFARPHISRFLAADEMFVQACLDGSGILDPKSKDRLSIYSKTNLEQESELASNGKRTETCLCHLIANMPRICLHLLKLSNELFCSLHACAWIVEKLRFLVSENVLSEKVKSFMITKRLIDESDLIFNLENNMNKRGVMGTSGSIFMRKQQSPPQFP